MDGFDERNFLADKQVLYFQQALTFGAVATITATAQAMTVTGVKVGDLVLSITKPTEQAGIALAGGHRVSATDTVQITFVNPTAGGVTPTAAEVYKIVVLR
jgi:hypothetical protein